MSLLSAVKEILGPRPRGVTTFSKTAPNQYGGFVMNGGEFINGSPPQLPQSPPSIYETISAQDNQAFLSLRAENDRRAEAHRLAVQRLEEQKLADAQNGIIPPGNPGTQNGNNHPGGSYIADVFAFVAPTNTAQWDQEVDVGITAREASGATLHPIEHAAELTKEFLEKNPGGFNPFAENRLVVDYTTNITGHLVRAYDGVEADQPGSWTTTANQIKGMTPDQIKEHLQLPHRPAFQTQVEVPVGQNVQRSFVADSTSQKALQYRINSFAARFFGEKKL